MSARERELGELPPPIWPLSGLCSGRGFLFQKIGPDPLVFATSPHTVFPKPFASLPFPCFPIAAFEYFLRLIHDQSKSHEPRTKNHAPRTTNPFAPFLLLVLFGLVWCCLVLFGPKNKKSFLMQMKEQIALGGGRGSIKILI